MSERSQLNLEHLQAGCVGGTSSDDGHERALLAEVDEQTDADEDRRHDDDVCHDLAVEAADVPTVQHHQIAHVEEQQLDEVHKLWHGERQDEIEDVARLAQDLIETDKDAQISDDAEVLKNAYNAGDHGAAHSHGA